MKETRPFSIKMKENAPCFPEKSLKNLHRKPGGFLLLIFSYSNNQGIRFSLKYCFIGNLKRFLKLRQVVFHPEPYRKFTQNAVLLRRLFRVILSCVQKGRRNAF